MPTNGDNNSCVMEFKKNILQGIMLRVNNGKTQT